MLLSLSMHCAPTQAAKSSEHKHMPENTHIESQPAPWVNQAHEGYVTNTGLSDENTTILHDFLREFETTIPRQSDGTPSFYAMPDYSLHITLADWIPPLFDITDNNGVILPKAAEFARIREAYSAALRTALTDIKPFDVLFNEVVLTPGTPIIKATDAGQFAHIRQTFAKLTDTPELRLNGAKPAPNIIHSSLGRFIGAQAVSLDDAQRFIDTHSLTYTQRVSSFRLVHTVVEPMKTFTILEEFPL